MVQGLNMCLQVRLGSEVVWAGSQRVSGQAHEAHEARAAWAGCG